MINLNIQMHSLELNEKLYDQHDKIRISVTTLPGEQKQAFTFNAKKMACTHPFFSVRVNERTEKLLIVIRKKSYTENNPIIASVVIPSGQFPNKWSENTFVENKTVNLLEPLQQASKKNENKKDRKIEGRVDVEFTLSKEIKGQNSPRKSSLSKRKNGRGKVECLLTTGNESDNFVITN